MTEVDLRQLSKAERAALLVAHGWTPTDPRSSNSWRSPDPADTARWSLAAAVRALAEQLGREGR